MNTTLNEKLNRIHATSTSTRIADAGSRMIDTQVVSASAALATSSAQQAAPLDAVNRLADDRGGVFARVLAFPFRAAQRTALSKVMHETRLALMNHRREAIERESQAIWEASSLKVVAVMAEYLNQHLRGIEQERFDHIMQMSQDAAALLTGHMEKIETASLPDMIKEKLLLQALTQYDITIERIQDSDLAQRHLRSKGQSQSQSHSHTRS